MRQGLDIIRLTSEEVEKILKWRNSNQNAVRNYKNVLNEGVIEVITQDTEYNEKFSANVYFKASDDGSTLYRFYIGNELIVECVTNREDSGYAIQSVSKTNYYDMIYNQTYKSAVEFIKDNLTIHCSTMAYITFKNNEVEIIEEDFLPKNRLEKALRHNKYNPNNPIKIRKKIVRLNKPTFKNVTKKEYIRVTKSWGVIGHDRHYKNGKITFIKPYTKGEGAKKPKVYKIDVNNP